MKNLVILKLGGSVVTKKNKNIPIVRTKIVQRIANELSRAIRNLNFSLILIHGTGSFGHPPAKKYNLDQGIKADPTRMGLSISKRFGYQLNHLLWKVLEEYNLPIVTLPPSAFTISTNKKIQRMDLEIIRHLLSIGRIPVLFGDEVMDTELGYSVLSSDQIACYLASRLKPDLLLFASDVNGIYVQNPKTHPKTRHINSISINALTAFRNTIIQHNPVDVSGEMAGKLKSLSRFTLPKKTIIRIFSGLIRNQVYRSLSGDKVGTTIKV